MSGPKLKRSGRGRLAPVAELFPPQGQWTEEDYFSLPDTNRLVELSEGEYWLVDPEEKTIEVYVLREGAYELTEKFRSGEAARSHRCSPASRFRWTRSSFNKDYSNVEFAITGKEHP